MAAAAGGGGPGQLCMHGVQLQSDIHSLGGVPPTVDLYTSLLRISVQGFSVRVPLAL